MPKPVNLKRTETKKKKIDEVEERLSPKKVSDLSFSEARAIREQYGSLKNYELATDKNRAKRIDEQMQDLSARRLVDAATSRGTPVEAESYGKNNKWNDYTTVMGERKSDYDRAVEKLKKDLDVYSPIADVSGVKNYLDATKAGYDNAVALGKSAADFGNAFKSADDFKRWSIGWDESRTGDKNFEDTEETRKARKDYYDGLKEKRSRLEAERTAAEQELYDFHQSDAYKNANYGSDEEKQNINTETGIQSRIWQYDADLEALDADIARYERFTEVQDRYAKLREDPNFERYASHSGYGIGKNGNTISTGNNVVDNYFGVSEKYKDVNISDPMFDARYGVSDQERKLIDFGYDYSLDELTEEEKQTYRYLLATQGADSADQFLEDMKPTLNRRAVQREANELKNASGWELAIRNIASVPQNIFGGVTAAIADVAQGDNKNPYDKWHRGAISASAVRGETAQRINNATGNANLLGFSLGDTYQALMSAADSAAGAALFGRAYTITMGAGAASSRAKELYENGASNNQILMSALASGLTEVVTEYVSVDKLVSNFLESTPKNKLDLILKMLSQGGIEASEEFAADILNTIQDNAILGSQSEWNKKLKEYMDGGMSREEAQQKVWLDTMGDALKSAAGGFVSGIAMGAPIAAANAVGNAIDTRREGRYVNENNGAEALQNLAREVAGAPNLTKAVDKVTKKASNKNVGKLSRALEQTIVNETDAETRSEKGAKYALAREGVDLSDVKAREGTNLYNNVDVSEKISDTGTTVDTETGGEITIDERNPITQRDGKTYLNTSAGEILQDDIKYSSEKEAQLYEYVSDLPQSVANAIVENYKGQDNVRGYVNGMRDGILLYGYNNIENAPKNTAFATLSEADQQYARQIGQTLAAEDLNVKPQTVGQHIAVKETATTSGERVMNLNEIGLKATPAVAKKIGAGGTAGAVYTKGDVDLNSAMGRADGLLAYVYSSIAGNSVVLYDSKTVKDADLKNANGKHVASDGTIYLDVRAEAGKNVTGGIAYTLGHELTHEAEQWAKKEYAAFKKFLYENYIEKGTAVEDLIAKKMSDLDTTDRAYAESEVVADACERMLLDSDAMEKLAELQDKEPGTFKKIVDFIKRALEKIVGKFNSIREVYETMGAENTRIESKLVQEFGDNLQKLQDMWSDMVVKAAQNRAAAVENKQTAEAKEQYSKKLSENEYARYMELAKDPEANKAELDRMVEQAAVEWGAADNGNGKPIDLYHGTPTFGFTVFADEKHEVPFIYTSTNRTVSAHYAGDQNYAFERPIGTKYRTGSSAADIIENAKWVLGSDYHVMSAKEKSEVYDKVKKDAVQVADKLNELFDAVYRTGRSDVWGNMPYEVNNAMALMEDPFWTISGGDYDYNFNENDGYREAWRSNFTEDGYDLFKDQSNIVREWRDENINALSKEEKACLSYLLGCEVSDTAIDIYGKMLRAATENDVLINKAGNLNDPSNLKEAMDQVYRIGAYHLYGNLGGNPFIFDANGAQFFAMKVPEIGDEYYDTDTVSKWAYNNGYTGVVMKNIYDYGDKADNYVFFNSSQLKSADPVTYDDQGNIIPLEERFNKNNDDIRYSRKISAEESKHYLGLAKDPQKNETQLREMVRDAATKAGYDSPMLYHGTNAFGFTIPKGYLFATDSEETAGTYSGTKSARNISEQTESNLGMYQLYANADGMLELDANGAETNHIALGDVESDFNNSQAAKSWHQFATINQIIKYAKENGYTGVIVKNVVDSATPESRKITSPATDYVFFSPQSQVKSADPVTYDDQGNVIPLEERFNEEKDDIRYSYKGRSSLTTPTGSLNINDIRDKQGNENLKIAYKMDREGVDSEKIRLATGWFKGYDGKWRSEIDDSDAKLASWIILGKGKRYMEERARNNTGDLRDKVFALQDRLAKSNKSNGANSDESKALRKEIRQTKKQREAASDLEFKISQNRLNLSDILDHPKLYENYPQLKDAVVHLSYTDGNDLGGAWGSTVLGSDEITLATNLNSREDILGTLMHEIQHVIQGIEGFASGANVEYWARRNKAESEDTRKAKLRLASVEDKLRNVDYNGNTAASPIKTAMSYAYIVDQLRTDKEGTANYDYDTEAKERYEERAKEGGYSDLLKEYLEAYQDVQIANMEAEDYPRAFADYQRTAGEIEARDVTGRLRMTEEERKAKRPDIDRNDVLFYSDQFSRKSSESYAVRDIVDRALKRLDPSSAEYRAMAKYKAELDTLDNMRAQLDEAIKNGDRQAQTRLTNNIKTQRGILNRIENSASMKNVASMRDVTRLADDAKKLREMLKLQSRETNGTIAKQRSVNAAASEIMEKYGIKRGKGELAELLGNYYTKMMQSVNNETMTREAALDQAREAAEWIARHVPDEIQYDDGAIEALDMLRGYKVKLNDDQRQNIRAKYDDINGWRRAVGGYITLSNEGKYLDELWPEWAERAPGYFTNEMISDADMPERLAEIIDSLKKSRETVIEVPGQYEYDLDRAANDVYEAFWNIEPEQTVADKYAERIKTLKAEHLKLMSDMRKSFRDTIREETREAYREGKQKAREYTRKIEVRRKVKKLAERLAKIYEKPQVNKYVPKSLAGPTLAVLSELDFETGRASKLAEKFGNLKLQYDAMMKGDEGKATYPQEISDLIEKMRTEVKGMAVKDMSADQLEDIYTTLKAFDHVLKTAREARNLSSSIGEDMTIYEAGEKWINEISETKEAKSVINKYTQQMLTPREFFERLASYKKNSISEKVFDMLNRAERKQAEIEMRSNMIFDDIMKNVKYLSQLSSTKNLVDIGLKDSNGNAVPITRGMMLAYYMHTLNEDNARHVAIGGMKAPDLKQYYKGDVDSYSNGKRIPGLVGAELAAQYEKIHDTLEGKRNKDGTRNGGLNEELQDAMDRNNSERVEELLEQRNQLWAERDEIIARGMRMIDQQRKAIEEMLTDEDKAFIKATQDYFENYSKDVLNEATMQMYGFEKARVENYFPIHSDANFLKAAFETVTNDASLENKGFMKDRVKAANPIMLEDFSSVINSQIQKTAQYAAFAPILREFNKLYSVKTGGVAAVDSVMGAIDEKFGQAGTKYISNLVADMNGARRRDTTFLDRARSNFAGAVLTLNPRVSMVQAASYPTAAAVVGYKALAKALALPDNSVVFKRANQELISKYTARHWQRNQGGADVTLHDAKSVNSLYSRANRRLRFLTGWIEAVDAGTVGRLWYASEYYVRDHFKNLERGTDEYYEKTAEVFDEVVERTQPNYTTLQRPDILRNPNQLVRSLTMFMTQRLQNFNIVYSAARRYAKYSSDLKQNKNDVTRGDVREARGNLARAISSQAMATATLAGIKLLADALLHNFRRRKDEETGDITAESVLMSTVDDFIGSLFSDIVGGSEAYDMVKAIVTGGKYYEPEIGGIGTFVDTAKNAVNLSQKIMGKDKPSANDFIKLGYNLAQIFGIPAENGGKIGKALWNHVQDIKNGEFGSFNAGDAKTEKQKGVAAYRAYERGDMETYEEISSTMKNPKDAIKYGTGSSYGKFDEAVETGEDLGGVIDEYLDMGYTKENLAAQITRDFKQKYRNASDKESLKRKLLDAYEELGYDEDKKSKDIDKWLED